MGCESVKGNTRTESVRNTSDTKRSEEHRSGRKTRVWFRVLLLVIVTIPLVLCAEPVLVILNGCDDIIPYRQPVAVDPLMDLEIPPNMDLTRWTDLAAARDSIGRIGVFSSVERLPSIEAARTQFEIECESRGERSRNVYGGQGDDRYCISSVRTERAGPEGLCSPLGRYSSYAIIQRGTVVIALYERSDHRASAAMDEAIEQLADELTRAIHN
jgi:hypothetical protein